MNEESKTLAASGSRIGELERFAAAVNKQRELIKALENKLDVVSDRAPTQETPPLNDREHLSTLIDLLSDNNRELARLHDELTL